MTTASHTHPAKIFNFCPKCGSAGFTFDNQKKFLCPVCQFTYYINAATAVAAILQAPDGRIVMTRRKFEPRVGYLDLPGGFVDPMERAEDALKREIMEELGVQVSEMMFLASFPNEYVYKNISYFTTDLAFVCPMTNLSSLKPNDDVAEAALIHPKEIDFDTISFPSIIHILKTYITKL
jgi:ADP-ribose pyrophosphatase